MRADLPTPPTVLRTVPAGHHRRGGRLEQELQACQALGHAFVSPEGAGRCMLEEGLPGELEVGSEHQLVLS